MPLHMACRWNARVFSRGPPVLIGGLSDEFATGRADLMVPIQIIAIIASGVAVFLGVNRWNMHTARRFQRELDALDAS